MENIISAVDQLPICRYYKSDMKKKKKKCIVRIDNNIRSTRHIIVDEKSVVHSLWLQYVITSLSVQMWVWQICFWPPYRTDREQH